MEAYIMKHLSAFGIPEVKHYGYNTNYNILIMELLGQSLITWTIFGEFISRSK